MNRLKELAEKRKQIAARPSYTKGGDYNDFVEYNRLGDLIIKEVMRMYEEGELK